MFLNKSGFLSNLFYIRFYLLFYTLFFFILSSICTFFALELISFHSFTGKQLARIFTEFPKVNCKKRNFMEKGFFISSVIPKIISDF